MDKAQMIVTVLRILLEKLAVAESRSDVANALTATREQFVEEVPVHAKKQ